MWVLRPEPGNSARVSSAPPHSITSVATMSVVLSQLPCGPVLWKELESYDYIYAGYRTPESISFHLRSLDNSEW